MSTPVDIKSAAKQLGISVQRTRTLCRQGKLPSARIGNSWLISQADLIKFGMKSGHMIAEDHPIYATSAHSSKPLALSFFSGAMGLDLGIEKAGFDIRLTCEVDRFCRQTILLNRPKIALLGDINECTAQDIRRAAGLSTHDKIDLIVGGPPCQAFSTAGKRQGFHDDRGNVFLKYLDLALELNPEYFVIENVRGLLSCPMSHRPHDQRGGNFPDLSEDELKGGALNFVLRKLENSGYGYSFNLYNAANFGTPQVRERVIIVCARNGHVPPYLTPTHSENGELGLPPWKTLASAIKGIESHRHLNFPEKRLKFYRLLKPGQNWRNLPPSLQQEAMGASFFAGGGKTGFFRRLAWDKPSPTLVTHPAMPATDLAHPVADRPLSVEEYRRIQEFPDTWEFAGPLVQQYKQIGNAVPASLGFAVGSLIIKLLKGVEVISREGFAYSRYKNTDHLSWKKMFQEQISSAKEESEPIQQKLFFG